MKADSKLRATCGLRVIGIGDNVVDNYIHLRRVFPGGNALNFAVFANMMGCDAAYMGIFGSDRNAMHVQHTLSEIGVDISHCYSVEGPNGEAMLTIEDGERTFISSNQGGVSKTVPMEFIFDDLEYLQSFSILHTSAYSYMDDYLSRLHPLDLSVSYDFSDDFDEDHALSLCKHIDFGFFSCSKRTEETTKELLVKAIENGCSLSVATRGAQETILFDGGSWFRQAPQSIKPKDTLGAGDAFIAAFLISYVKSIKDAQLQKDQIIKKALQKGASFAAEICQIQGAFGHGRSY